MSNELIDYFKQAKLDSKVSRDHLRDSLKTIMEWCSDTTKGHSKDKDILVSSERIRQIECHLLLAHITIEYLDKLNDCHKEFIEKLCEDLEGE